MFKQILNNFMINYHRINIIYPNDFKFYSEIFIYISIYLLLLFLKSSFWWKKVSWLLSKEPSKYKCDKWLIGNLWLQGSKIVNIKKNQFSIAKCKELICFFLSLMIKNFLFASFVSYLLLCSLLGLLHDRNFLPELDIVTFHYCHSA